MRKTPLWRLIRILLAVLTLAAVVGRPGVAIGAPDDAKVHFQRGVRLFEDSNFDGALLEFQRSFELNPTASALQNMAVCQKSMHRYTDAIATLQKMLRDFAQQLSASDRKSAEDAIREMSDLLGSVLLRVTPPDARVTLDDQVIGADALKSPIRLSTGEHRVVADADGYKRLDQVVKVISGESKTVNLALQKQTGVLWVRVGDPQAAIVVDGKQVGYEEWKGSVDARSHDVVVLTDKLRHRATVHVQQGQIAELDVKLGADDVVTAEEPGVPAYVPPPNMRGFYGYLAALAGGASLPGGLLTDNTRVQKAPALGGAGIAFGYRFSSLWAAETVLDGETASITTCDGECTPTANKHSYTLSITHLSANGRIMTKGRKFRVFGTIGGGIAGHALTGDAKRSGAGAYGRIGGGIELNFGHFLGGAGLTLSTEGLGQIAPPAAKDRTLGLGVLDLRFGYGQW